VSAALARSITVSGETVSPTEAIVITEGSLHKLMLRTSGAWRTSMDRVIDGVVSMRRQLVGSCARPRKRFEFLRSLVND